MKQILVNGLNIRFVDQGAGIPILLVHGFPLDATMWRYQIEALSEAGRVICPDLPGFGASDALDKPFFLEDMSDVLSALLDQLDVDRVVYCGLSMGGYIGWQFWKRHRHRLRGLIASNTRAAADGETVARARRFSAAMLREHGTTALASELPNKLFAPSTRRGPDVDAIRDVIGRSDPETLARAQLAMSQRTDATGWLEQINLPTLFVVGRQDSITTLQEMRENQSRVADSRLVVIDDAGHLAPLENPAEFNAAVREFLTTVQYADKPS